MVLWYSDVVDDFIKTVRLSDSDTSFALTIERDSVQKEVLIQSKELRTVLWYPKVGVSFETNHKPASLLDAIRKGTLQTYQTTRDIFWSLKVLILGDASLNDLAGPVGLFQVASHELNRGFLYFLNIMALISINLAIINLFPFSVLDGGHLFILAIEWVRGKAVPLSVVSKVQQIGVLVLLSLMIFLVVNDVMNWGSRIDLFGSVK